VVNDEEKSAVVTFSVVSVAVRLLAFVVSIIVILVIVDFVVGVFFVVIRFQQKFCENENCVSEARKIEKLIQSTLSIMFA